MGGKFCRRIGADGFITQASGNYGYDQIGNLIKDNSEGISKIEWTLYGKVKCVTKTDGTVTTYRYDATGTSHGATG